MSEFNENGLILDRYDDIKTKLEDAFKSIAGSGFKTTPSSVGGQVIALISETVADQNELVEGVVNAFDPSGAVGVYLSKLVLFNGIERKKRVASVVEVTLTANAAGSTVSAGSLFCDPAVGENFALDAEVVLAPLESKTETATAINFGPLTAEAGSITKIVNPVYGLATVINPTDAIPGQDREQDPTLRPRRTTASKGSGSANVAAIYTAIANIDGVIACRVFENKTDFVDLNGVPGHSIWAIVEGGADEEIAAALFGTVDGGVGLHGSTVISYADPITGQTYAIPFERPIQDPIYISINMLKNAKYPGNGDATIKAAIVAYGSENFSIGDSIVQSRLYSPANETPGHTISDLFIGTAPNPVSESDLLTAVNHIGVFDVSRIKINGI
jgi:uncharacterized phage protein gp47/JayE